MSDNESPAVELRGVSFSYCCCRKHILEDVSLTLRSGEVTAILGPNGCGKSTTVKLINRQLTPSAGQVVIEGRNVADMGRKEVARHVAVLGQAVGVASMRAEQFVMCGRYPHRAALASPTARDHEIVHNAMCQAGCLQHAGADMARLSGGERQRVLLAAVLAQEANVVVMDEPTTYLDPTACFELMAMARGLAQGGAAVAMVLHDIPLALSFCDRAAVLAQGHVQAFGSAEEVADSGIIDRVLDVRLHRMPADADGRAGYCLMPRR